MPIDFNLYKDNIWCNVVTTDVGEVILRRKISSTIDLTCVNSNMRVRRLGYCHPDPRLDNLSRRLPHQRKLRELT